MRIVLTAIALAACHYDGGSYSSMFRAWPGTRVALPCIDLSVDAVHERGAADAVVAYSFGNRCDHRVAIDLASVRVVGRDEAGRETPLRAYDPNHEIRVLPLPARLFGQEHIQYLAEAPLTEVCVDVGGIGAEARVAERWACFPGAGGPP